MILRPRGRTHRLQYSHYDRPPRWPTLLSANGKIETETRCSASATRLYVDTQSKIELEIFQDQKDKIFSFRTLLHFYKPTEESDKKRPT